jgi:hypothetical protein
MIVTTESSDSKTMVQLILAHWALSKDRSDYFVRLDPLSITDEINC